MPLDSITNRGEFFSNHYLAAVISGDINDVRKLWDELEGRDEPSPRSRLRSGAGEFFARRASATEAGRTQQANEVRRLNEHALSILGFEPDRQDSEFDRADSTDVLGLPTAARIETSTGLLAIALDAGLAADVDQLVTTAAPQRDDLPGHPDTPHLLLDRGRRTSEKNQRVETAADGVSELFSIDDPPRYVLVAGGRVVLLAERAKWAEGRFLAVDLDAALERMDTAKGGEIETIAALFSAEALTPADGQSTLDELTDNSHKHAVGVSKDLRDGIRQSIEILANATIEQLDAQAREARRQQFSRTDVDARDLTTQCLRWVYRLLVLLYAESRPELGILPVNDDAYMQGYSLDRLRELCLVDLDTDRARSGSHFDESLKRLFQLVNDGYHAETAEQQLFLDADTHTETREEYLQFPGLDALLFEPAHTALLDRVTLPNEVLQKVLGLLMLSPEKSGRGRRQATERGFISYAQLGINQLGAVYEGLMAYTGFFAREDLYEVAKSGDPADGTWVLPVTDADEYPDDVFVTHTDEVTGQPERVLHARGSFVFRLSGRDRQRSASYYTPEVLTRCVVKHALAELLGLDDYAPEHGSSGITEAVDMLDLTICEPALGSGAFANEAINQLAAEYLKRRQAELGETLDPDRYLLELQKVKAHYALHQTYGVDLNSTAVELAEVSLWLNCMYPGLKAPWFGLQLRRGNSLIGCRRATWRTADLWRHKKGPWAETGKGKVKPPVDRKLHDPLDGDEVHHFLLPGHGWAAVADRKEAKELRPDEVEALKTWRKTILAAPRKADEQRLRSLAAAVEETWAQAAERIRLVQQALRRPIDVYGANVADRWPTISREEAERILNDPDSPLGRLRALMDAWIGLWFWPLNIGVTPPSWNEWLDAAEDLVRPAERHGPSGQLAFDDLASLVEAQQRLALGQKTVADLRGGHPWLRVAADAARREGSWHWDLEFSPAFLRGGFDLQIGNPPWVKLGRDDDAALAEIDPWWGVLERRPPRERRARRSVSLAPPEDQERYIDDLSFDAAGELAASNVYRQRLAGLGANLYLAFIDTTWRHRTDRGIAALLHPEGHYADTDGQRLRRDAYRRLRRHFHFLNEREIFEDVGHTRNFGINVYADERPPSFLQVCNVFDPITVDESLMHDGAGPLPGIQLPQGGWDTRPHRRRLVHVDPATLAGWAALFDGTTDGEGARLLRPCSDLDQGAIEVLSSRRSRVGDAGLLHTSGLPEKQSRETGAIEWETRFPNELVEVILQGPHFSLATPFAKQPNENCQSKGDYSAWDLEGLERAPIPRTNYQWVVGTDRTELLDDWRGQPANRYWRMHWRRMTQPGIERSLQVALLPPGPMHVETVLSATAADNSETVALAGCWSSIPMDFVVKVSGKSDIRRDLFEQFPRMGLSDSARGQLALRTLRLNCLTADYAPLWEELFDPEWQQDRWTDPEFDRLPLGDIGPEWSMTTPLRRDFERRLALVELDALAALMLGLTAEQLCAMYRTQFAVLRKYEYKMAFDAEGRKICGYHQSAGYRQSQLQDQAKAGDLPKEWSNLWKLYEQYEDDPDSVDWLGHYTPPFTRADREMEMTRAYNEFQRRLDAGEYE